MPAISVTSTPAQITSDWSDLQCLGPADVYLGNANTVSSSNGVKIASGGTYSRPVGRKTKQPIWIVTASGTADVRILA